MKKILKGIKILATARFVYKKPPKKKIIIFDKKSEIYISDLFYKNEYTVLDISYNELNLFIIFRLILKFKKINFINYFHEYLIHIQPQYVFTFIDNNLGFYKLRSRVNNIKFISIQNGIRFITGDILERLKKDKKKYFVDYYFTFNENYSKIVNKYIEGKYIMIGSYKNNLFSISKNYQRGTICYISRISNIFFNSAKNKDKDIVKNQYESWEIKLVEFVIELLRNLSTYCNQNQIILNILGSNLNHELENNFFQDNLKENSYNFIPKNKIYDSYKNIDKFEILVNPMSTFGYEAIAREKKVCFFSGDFIEGSSFNWPNDENKKGAFFSNSNSLNEVKRILDFLLKINDESWSQEISQFKNKVYFHNKDNTIIKNFLSENKISKKWLKSTEI